MKLGNHVKDKEGGREGKGWRRGGHVASRKIRVWR